MADLFSQPEPVRRNADELFDILERLLDDGVLSFEDIEFPRWLCNRLGERDPSVLLASAHLTSLTRQGHVGTRIPLRKEQVPVFGHERGKELSDGDCDTLEEWIAGMKSSLEQSEVVGSKNKPAHPLIYDRGYLYYQRYWSYECTLAGQLSRMAGQAMDGFGGNEVVKWIETLLPGEDEGTRWQRLALWMALRRRLLVLTGGPGTGKTFTLIRLVALQKLLREKGGADWNVALAAPTGKAAARINESVAESIEDLQSQVSDELVQKLPTEAQTIHRLLGTRRNRPEFRHNSDNPLPHDVVVVDEASMVDIALMTKLVESLKSGAQLILIGDKDQLASVEAGSVLGDICQPLPGNSDSEGLPANLFSQDFEAELRQTSLVEMPEGSVVEERAELLDCMVELTRSRRFENAPDIGKLAGYVNRNKGKEAVQHLRSADDVSIELPEYLGEIRDQCEQWEYVDQEFTRDRAADLFRSWSQFQILAAHRRGSRSAAAVNQLMEDWMRRREGGNLLMEESIWYAGRPIIVTENNYELKLFNGDIGLTVRDSDRGGQLRVVFEKRSGGEGESPYRSVAPAQLTRYEPAWALTVHKSQGSEFGEVLLIMPERLSPVLTRELVYTALTRSRRRFTVWSEADLFKKAVRQRIHRTSALGERLWGKE